jgi:hypothetical protein
MAQVVEYLLSKHKALGSTPLPTLFTLIYIGRAKQLPPIVHDKYKCLKKSMSKAVG